MKTMLRVIFSSVILFPLAVLAFNGAPLVEFSAAQRTGCDSLTTTFSDISLQNPGDPFVGWLWDFGDGTSSTAPSPTHTYDSPGNYNVTLTLTAQSGWTGYSTINSYIKVNASPAVDLGPDVTICDDGSTAVLSAGNPGATFSWSTGETSSTIEVIDPGTYTVTVTKNTCSAQDSVHLTVTPVLWSDFTYAKVSGCVPVDMQFTDKSTACLSTIVNRDWDFGDGQHSSSINPLHTFNSAGQFIVKLRITDSNGDEITRSKKVIIAAPTFSVDLGMDTTICFGESLTLNASTTGATYAWSTGETTPQIEVIDEGDYIVGVTVNSCELKDTITVKTSSPVLANFGAVNDGECLPVSVKFSDSSSVFCGQSISKWNWDFGDGSVSTEQNPVHQYFSADSFFVKLTITSSGGNTISKTRKIYIRNTVPELNLPETLTTCYGGSVMLDAQVAGAVYSWSPSFGLNESNIKTPTATTNLSMWYKAEVTKCMVTVSDSVHILIDSIFKPEVTQSRNTLVSSEANSYQWYNEGNPIAGATAKTLRVDHAGYYMVKVKNRSGCENSSDPFFYVPVSGNEKETGIRIKCSPNPTHGLICILLSEIPKKPATVSVIDANGRKLFTTNIQKNYNPLEGLKLRKGMYFIQVIIDKERTLLPVVVQ